MIKEYYLLTKPGIIRGNIITASAGFLLASRGTFDAPLFLMMVLGLSFIIASGCVFNNYFDRQIDSKMGRTKKRPLVTGKISNTHAITFAAILGVVGFLTLYYVSFLSFLMSLIGFVVYVALYTPLKKRSLLGTFIGSASGAVPPVVGYTAVSETLDLGALLLFVILVAWQMPHFYAISIFRLKEYSRAAVPTLPEAKGILFTKFVIIIFVVAFIVSTLLLSVFGYTGKTYLATILIIGFGWLGYGIKGFAVRDNDKWARRMFGLSLVILLIFSILIAGEIVLP